MSTGSTKSRARKAAGSADVRNATPEPEDSSTMQTGEPEISPRVWWIASLCILAVAALLRLYELGLKPLHHDEGVNGFFLTNLYRDGVYHYNPENYHGPTLYYFALAVTKLNGFLFGDAAGLSTVAVRLVPAFFGIATVWLALQLRRRIGAIGALTAAALIALSPGNVYVSRYFIHEAHFVFFTLGIVVAALRYWETADPVYLMLASISAALLFATKETAIISVVVLGLAWAVSAIYMRLVKRGGSVPWEKKGAQGRKRKNRRQPLVQRAAALERFGGPRQVALMAALALSVFIFVNILFYSSFFTYWEGVDGAIQSLKIWAGTGTKDHGHPWHTYLWWLLQEEAPLLILGTGGAILALVLRRNRFAIFAGAWAFGILAAYSLIPYKTPWLMLSFIVPLAIVGGYCVDELYRWARSSGASLLALALAVAACAVCAVQAVRLSFYRYDDDKYPYVYAHTYREFLPLIDEIDELAKRAGTGKETGVTITAGEYWPMPWYMRNYPKAGFWGKMVETQEPIVVGSLEQEQELVSMLGDRYVRVNAYPLRPGVTLLLYARRDLVEGGR
ncbi:MAG TPA: flippase activity-associated protein Agl23 [Pyrinomonadaceae bacterium]|nr:flippase activity-associated protein Agl23 [Pyrinomonadaceae bacterium]